MQIFIPDGQTMASVSKGYDLATAEERDMARERATLQVGAPAPQGTPQREEEELPEWWNPSPALHVSLYYKDEVHALRLTWTFVRYPPERFPLPGALQLKARCTGIMLAGTCQCWMKFRNSTQRSTSHMQCIVG